MEGHLLIEGRDSIRDLKLSIASNVTPIVIEEIVNELFYDHFSDLNERLSVFMKFLDFQQYYGLQITGDENHGIIIEGIMPMDLVHHGDFIKIIKGFLAHEMGHVALRHHEIRDENILKLFYNVGLNNNSIGLEKFAPLLINKNAFEDMGRNVFSDLEHSVDEEAIKRGLGNEIYCSRVYAEDFRKKYGGSIQLGYYTSKEIEGLLGIGDKKIKHNV